MTLILKKSSQRFEPVYNRQVAYFRGENRLHMRHAYVKLPPLYVLAGVLVRNDNDKLGNLAADHPLI